MRPRKDRTAVCAMFAVVGLLAVGCGQRDAASPSPGVPSSDRHVSRSAEPGAPASAVVNWANDYCGAVTELVRSVSAMPTIDPSSPQRASRTSSALLDAVVDGLERTVDRLSSLDEAPSPDAEAILRSAVADYREIKNTAAGVKSRLDSATDPAASRAALSRVNEPLDDIGELNLLDGFAEVPQLRRASEHAPACRELIGDGPAPRIDPSTGG